MSAREFPDWMYSFPDSRSARIAELELSLAHERAEKESALRQVSEGDASIRALKAALLESNNVAARYADLLSTGKKARP